MNLIYSPWMNHFLKAVAESNDDILLVSPFIKLSLVKPFLLSLPNKNLKLTVVTRFNKLVFQQQASDISALELLRLRPKAPGPTQIFMLNRLHAKLYIFNKNRIFIGSSNLSISGLDRNFEMVVEIDNAELASDTLKKLENKALLARELHDNDFIEMRKALQIPERIMQLSIESELSEDEEAKQIEHSETSDEPIEPEIPIENTPITEDAEDRNEEINNYILKTAKPNLNFIAGEEAESIKHRIIVSPEGVVDEQSLQIATDAAKRDIERIVTRLSPAIGLDQRYVDQNAFISAFIHQSWSNTYNRLKLANLGWQRFSNLGNALLNLEAAIFYAKPIAFDNIRAGAASLAMRNLKYIDYNDFLISRGIGVLLHTNDSIEKDFQKKQVAAIIGIQYKYSGYHLARRFIRPLIDENLSIFDLKINNNDPKSLIQEIAQELGQSKSYTTNNISKSKDESLFESYVTIGRRKFEKKIGHNKKSAEQKAAESAVTTLKSDPAYRGTIDKYFTLKTMVARAPYRISRIRYAQCSSLAEKLELKFSTSPAILDIALTHSSYYSTDPSSRSNLRLAFVGAHVLNVLTASFAIDKCGWLVEHSDFGKDTSIINYLNIRVLPSLFDQMKLSTYIQLGEGQRNDVPPSIKKDVVQAVFAVAYLWGGIAGATRLWEKWIPQQLVEADDINQTKHPIQLLQEIAQSIGLPVPEYRIEQSTNKDQTVTVHCYIDDSLLSTGTGTSKKDARIDAAKKALNPFKEKYADMLAKRNT